MSRLARALLAHPVPAAVAAALLACALGWGVGELYRASREADYRRTLDNAAQREAAALQGWTLTGKGMGAVALTGQIDPQVREATQETDVARARRTRPAEAVLHVVAASVEADHAFVANAQGIITGDWDSEGHSPIGLDIRFRPYFQQALRGTESVYPGISSTTGERVFYVAAPVYRSPGRGDTISGVVVARFYAPPLDRFLDNLPHTVGLLVSPSGVVFAANRPQWLLALVGERSERRIAEIAASRQFGKHFNVPDKVLQLPFAVDGRSTRIGAHRHAVARAEVEWNDRAGRWQVLLLGNLDAVVPEPERMGVAALAAALLFAFFFSLLRSLRHRAERERNEQELQRQHQQLQLILDNSPVGVGVSAIWMAMPTSVAPMPMAAAAKLPAVTRPAEMAVLVAAALRMTGISATSGPSGTARMATCSPAWGRVERQSSFAMTRSPITTTVCAISASGTLRR